MKNEQFNLYGADKEQFKQTGKMPEELEKEAAENTLINKIIQFVEDKENELKKISDKEGKLGGRHIHELAKEFNKGAEGEELIAIKKILAKTLQVKGYELKDSVLSVEIDEKDLDWLKERKEAKRAKTDLKLKSVADEKKELRKKREKLPGPQRGLPTGDLD